MTISFLKFLGLFSQGFNFRSLIINGDLPQEVSYVFKKGFYELLGQGFKD